MLIIKYTSNANMAPAKNHNAMFCGSNDAFAGAEASMNATAGAAALSAMAERAAAPAVAFMEASAPAKASLLPQNIALWFLAGAIFALLVYLMISMFRKRLD